MSGSSGRKSNPWVIALVVTLGAFMEVLDTTIVNVALPHIAGSLSVSSDEATWTLTTYLVSNAIVLTISGALAARLGRKRYFLFCLAGFTATSFACGVSTEFWQILVFRGLQGFFGGGLQPTQQAIILDNFPPEKRQSAFAITAIAIIIAPVLGPLVGGYITDTYSWHWIFLINVPIGVATIFGVLQVVPEPPDLDQQRKKLPPFDYVGVAFIALALGCMEIATDRGEDYDWLGSGIIRWLYGLSAAGFLFGCVWLTYAKHPVVNLRVFKDRNFALGALLIGMMGFILYASAVLIPQFAQQQLGYDSTWAGVVLAPGAVVLIVLIPIAGRALALVPGKYVIAFGGFALSGSLFYSMNLVPGMDFYHLAVLRATQTAGLAFLFVPISTIAYATLPKRLNGDATALFTMSRNFFGGLGISISTALVTDHNQMRQQDLIQYTTQVYQPYNDLIARVAEGLRSVGYSAEAAAQAAPGQVFSMLREQVAVLSYMDVFMITGTLTLLMVPAALFMSNIKIAGGGGGE